MMMTTTTMMMMMMMMMKCEVVFEVEVDDDVGNDTERKMATAGGHSDARHHVLSTIVWNFLTSFTVVDGKILQHSCLRWTSEMALS